MLQPYLLSPFVVCICLCVEVSLNIYKHMCTTCCSFFLHRPAPHSLQSPAPPSRPFKQRATPKYSKACSPKSELTKLATTSLQIPALLSRLFNKNLLPQVFQRPVGLQRPPAPPSHSSRPCWFESPLCSQADCQAVELPLVPLLPRGAPAVQIRCCKQMLILQEGRGLLLLQRA